MFGLTNSGAGAVTSKFNGSVSWATAASVCDALEFGGDLNDLSSAERVAWFDEHLTPVIHPTNGDDDIELKKTNHALTVDNTAADLSGASGNVMVKFDRLWIKRATSNGYQNLSFKEEAADGYKQHAFKFNGNYQDHMYIGMFEATLYGGKLASVYSTSATPYVSVDVNTFRAKALLNGSNYGIMNPLVKSFWNDIFLATYGNRDSQTVVGNGLVGLTAASPVATAATLTSGISYGTAANQTTHCKALYCVNPWGNVWERLDGYIHINGACYIADDLTKMISLSDSVTAADLLAAGWTNTGLTTGTTAAWNYPTQMSFNEWLPYMPTVATSTGGSTSAYFADGLCSNTGTRVGCVGGSWAAALYAGAFGLALDTAPSSAFAYVGARLLAY